MPAPATLSVAVTFPAPLVYATKAGQLTAAVTRAAALATPVKNLVTVKTGVS